MAKPKQYSLEWTETSGGLWERWHDPGVPLPFLWRVPHLEMRREQREFFPDHAGKGTYSRCSIKLAELARRVKGQRNEMYTLDYNWEPLCETGVQGSKPLVGNGGPAWAVGWKDQWKPGGAGSRTGRAVWTQSAPGLVFIDCIELLCLWLQRI